MAPICKHHHLCAKIIGRTPGRMALWMEMMNDPEFKIARPRQIYTGARRGLCSDGRALNVGVEARWADQPDAWAEGGLVVGWAFLKFRLLVAPLLLLLRRLSRGF